MKDFIEPDSISEHSLSPHILSDITIQPDFPTAYVASTNDKLVKNKAKIANDRNWILKENWS